MDIIVPFVVFVTWNRGSKVEKLFNDSACSRSGQWWYVCVDVGVLGEHNLYDSFPLIMILDSYGRYYSGISACSALAAVSKLLEDAINYTT